MPEMPLLPFDHQVLGPIGGLLHGHGVGDGDGDAVGDGDGDAEGFGL